mmetsp:Transcript_97302/g.135198  ORF Transcript_97302/g.135198 Transcript_97302/m.135198 type:complete len:139 (-) Transcript_97302:321-737(-)
MGQVESSGAREPAGCMSGLGSVLRPQAQTSTTLVKVTVCLLGGESRTMLLPDTSTGREIKMSIQTIFAVPETEQRLACGGSLLGDESRPLRDETHICLDVIRVHEPRRYRTPKHTNGRVGSLLSTRLVGQKLQVRRRY